MSAPGGDPLDPRSYVRGGRILIGKLGRRGIAAIIAAMFSGSVGLLLSIADLPLALLAGFSSFYGSYIATIGNVLALLARGSVAAAAQSVADAGIFGFVLAALIITGSGFIFTWVFSRAI